MHALTIEYNDSGSLMATSGAMGGLNIHLYNSSKGYVYMRVSVKSDGGAKADYWLKTIKPGDHLKFSYAAHTESSESSIAAIEGFARKDESYAITPGLRIGFDVTRKDGSKLRLSHPPDGGFDFILGNVPRDHARCFVMAENDEEGWNWQLDDLYDGDSIELEIVETDWNTPFPRVQPHPAG